MKENVCCLCRAPFQKPNKYTIFFFVSARPCSDIFFASAVYKLPAIIIRIGFSNKLYVMCSKDWK